MAKPSQIQELKTEFRAFKSKAVEILEKLNRYNFEKDTLGLERVKAREIQKLINSLKGE